MKILVTAFMIIHGMLHLVGASLLLLNKQWWQLAGDYRPINGLRLAYTPRTFYKYQEDPFCYGEFTLRHIDYHLNSKNRQ